MVRAEKFVYDFKRKLNTNDTGKNLDLPLHVIIAYINEALQIWFRNRVSVAQTNQRVRNELRPFKEDFVSLNLQNKGSHYIAEYPANLHTRLNQIAVATKDCCNDSKEIIPRIIESDDLHEARNNPYRKADFFYEQLLAIESKEGLILYTDGEMDLESVKIDYYRKPQEIHAPKFEECADLYYMYDNRVITNNSDFEGIEDSANDIVDIAVLCATVDTRSSEAFQTRLNLILQSQGLYK